MNIDRVFHALGDPTRRAIVEKVTERPYSVTALAIPLEITVTAVGQHLQLLEESGLVRTEKVGRVRTCCLESSGFAALEQWIQNRRSSWERSLDRLGSLLAEPDADEPELDEPDEDQPGHRRGGAGVTARILFRLVGREGVQ